MRYTQTYDALPICHRFVWSARARKRRARPSAPTAAPMRRRGKSLCSSSSLSSRINGYGNSDTPRRFTPTSHQRPFYPLLQAGCTCYHALNLLVLHNEMQLYHLEVEGIPEYINMFEDAQKQAGRSRRTIANKKILLFASTAMLTTERYYRANDGWEDQAEDPKPGPTGRPATRRRTLRHASKHKPPKEMISLIPRMQESGSPRTTK